VIARVAVSISIFLFFAACSGQRTVAPSEDIALQEAAKMYAARTREVEPDSVFVQSLGTDTAIVWVISKVGTVGTEEGYLLRRRDGAWKVDSVLYVVLMHR